MINIRANIKDETNLAEYSREFLFNRPDGLFSSEIVREVFLLDDVSEEISLLLVKQLLDGLEDFYCDKNGKWHLRSSSQLQLPFKNLSLTIVDLETTGGGTKAHRIIEIGAVKIINGKIRERFNTFVNPHRRIPDFVTKITGITQEMIADAPLPAEAMPSLIAFIRGSIFIAHNLPYDWGFINTTLSRLGSRQIRNHTLCTLELARILLPHLRNHKLEDLARYFNITIKARHRALDDAEATALILLHFIDMLEEAGIHNLQQTYQLLPKKERLDVSELMIDKRDIHVLPEEKGVFKFIDSHGEVIYVEGAINIRHRVRECLYGKNPQSLLMKQIIRNVARIEALPTSSYLQAKLKECRLIEEYHPRFNVLRKTQLPLLHLTDDNGSAKIKIENDFLPNNGSYYGPVFQKKQIEAVQTLQTEQISFRTIADISSPEKSIEILIPAMNHPAASETDRPDRANLFAVSQMTIYVTESLDYNALELCLIQNYRIIGIERIRFIDEAIDLLREEILFKISPFFRPVIDGLPKVRSQIDLLWIETIHDLESSSHCKRYRIQVDLNFSRVHHIVNNIIRLGYRISRHRLQARF